MGSANSNIVQVTVTNPCADPVFAPAPGTYAGLVDVTITCATPGSSIFYTTDGSTPTPLSTPYIAPVGITNTSTLKAIATASGFSNSNVTSGLYTITTVPTVTPTLSVQQFVQGGHLFNQVTISWNAIGAPAVNYRVKHQLNGGGFSVLATVADPGNNTADAGLASSWVQGQRDYFIEVLDAGNNVIETTPTVSSLWWLFTSGDNSTGPFGLNTGEGWASTDSATFPNITNAVGVLNSPNPLLFKGQQVGISCFIDNPHSINIFMTGTLPKAFFAGLQFTDKNSNLTQLLTSAATLDTSTFPGFTLWSWNAPHNFPFQNGAQTQMSTF